MNQKNLSDSDMEAQAVMIAITSAAFILLVVAVFKEWTEDIKQLNHELETEHNKQGSNHRTTKKEPSARKDRRTSLSDG